MLQSRRPKILPHHWDRKICILFSQERLGADDEQDGVFVDYCSFSQKAFDDIPDVYFASTTCS